MNGDAGKMPVGCSPPVPDAEANLEPSIAPESTMEDTPRASPSPTAVDTTQGGTEQAAMAEEVPPEPDCSPPSETSVEVESPRETVTTADGATQANGDVPEIVDAEGSLDPVDLVDEADGSQTSVPLAEGATSSSPSEDSGARTEPNAVATQTPADGPPTREHLRQLVNNQVEYFFSR